MKITSMRKGAHKRKAATKAASGVSFPAEAVRRVRGAGERLAAVPTRFSTQLTSMRKGAHKQMPGKGGARELPSRGSLPPEGGGG